MIDLLITQAKQVLTLRASEGNKVTEELGIIEDGAIAIKGEEIVAVGKTDEVRDKVEIDSEKTQIIEASGKVVMPGFIDCHTHLVYAGSREYEFEMRLKGVSYEEIAAKGGGIKATVRATREASKEELSNLAKSRLERMLLWGTTTVEGKSGYGLSLDSEIKLLETIASLNKNQPVELVPTFLGGHEVPDEFQNNRKAYIRLLTEKMIPVVAEKELAEFCDVFCEQGVFTVEESEEILKAGENAGLKAKIHADELTPSGGAELAGRMHAVSADHLIYPSESGLQLMRDNGTVAVLLPGTSMTLRKPYAPARKMIEMGLTVAIATDHNPGTCTLEAMPIVIGLACLKLEMTPAEAIRAATINAACALDRQDKIGSLEPQKQADITILNIPHYRYLPYHFGVNYVDTVIKKGKVVISRS
ncbi:MAG: imidazolonepropionase [Candidatus Edwardsbacteria bacterium]